MMDNVELRDLMRSRANMYNMLSRAFIQETDETFLSELKRMRFPQNTGNAEVDDGYLDLYSFLRRTEESVIDDLAVDYARTFLGAGTMEARAAYPFESVYTSPKGLLMQDARDETLAIYKSEGLAEVLHNSFNEGEDHIALQLMFMREMALRTASALENDDEERCVRYLLTQRNFLNDHILDWALTWAKDVPKYAKQGFYPAFARLTAAFLQEDAELLVELVGDDENNCTADGSLDGADATNDRAAKAACAERSKEGTDHV